MVYLGRPFYKLIHPEAGHQPFMNPARNYEMMYQGMRI